MQETWAIQAVCTQSEIACPTSWKTCHIIIISIITSIMYSMHICRACKVNHQVNTVYSANILSSSIMKQKIHMANP